MRNFLIICALAAICGCDKKTEPPIEPPGTPTEVAIVEPAASLVEPEVTTNTDTPILAEVAVPVDTTPLPEQTVVREQDRSEPAITTAADEGLGFSGLETALAPVEADLPAQGSCQNLRLQLPERRSDARTGTQIAEALSQVRGSERDQAIVQEVLAGNIPTHMRTLAPLQVNGTRDGSVTAVTLCVAKDYLAVGSDSDYVRFPLGMTQTLQLLNQISMMLPTRQLVDAIYQNAQVKLVATPINFDANPTRYPGGYTEANMNHTRTILSHNEMIQGQLNSRTGIIAGSKKDLVMSLGQSSSSLCIYGWQRSNGEPIQRGCGGHGYDYADYSHGIRLVSKTVFINNRPVSLDSLPGISF